MSKWTVSRYIKQKPIFNIYDKPYSPYKDIFTGEIIPHHTKPLSSHTEQNESSEWKKLLKELERDIFYAELYKIWTPEQYKEVMELRKKGLHRTPEENKRLQELYNMK